MSQISENIRKIQMKRLFISSALRRHWGFRYTGIRFRLMDINCMGYLGLMGFLLIFFHKTVSQWPLHVLIHAGIVFAILEIVRLGERHPERKIFWILRTFYPIAIVLYGWSEIDALGRMFFGTYWSTEAVIRLDKIIFGVHPTVWFQKLYSPWLDELMCLFYSGYYVFMPLVSLILFIKGKREETLAAFSIGTLVYFSNYSLFYLFPTLSPAMVNNFQDLHASQYTGYVFAEITRIVQASGSVRGGTIPSSHISAVVAWSLIALHYRMKLGYVLILLVLGVAISTVYLGYHHAVDPIFGIIWGAICYPLGLYLIKARGEDTLL